MNLLGIDPGGTTGFCLWIADENKYYLHQQATPVGDPPWEGVEEFSKTVKSLVLRGMKPRAEEKGLQDVRIILEPFEFRHDERHRDKIDYTPAELNGAMKALYRDDFFYNPVVSMVTQSSSQVMTFWTENKLRRLGLWKGHSQEHCMDALRHVLHYRTFTLNDKSELVKLK